MNLLYIVIQKKNLSEATHLINSGINLEGVGFNNETPLHIAFQYLPEIVILLIEKGANIYAVDNNNNTPIHKAVQYNLKEFKALLYSQEKVDVNILGLNHKTPLHIACLYQSKIAMELIKYNANIDLLDDRGRSALFYACYFHSEVALLLIKKNARLNDPDFKGDTPLHIASIKNLSVVKMLVHNNADIYTENNLGLTAFDVAQENSQYEIMAFLEKNSFYKEDRLGLTTLMKAVNSKNEDYIFALIENGGDMKHKNSLGQSALDILMRKNNISVKLKRLKEVLLLENFIINNNNEQHARL